MARIRLAALLLGLALIAALEPGAVHASGVPNDSDAVVHALNRLTYGPRPGDVERVRGLGLAAWIDRQLTPARIDDAALDRRLPDQPVTSPQLDSPKSARRAARAAIGDLTADKLLRATYSERQLEELLVDFWFNHFNVFAGKGRVAAYLPEYEREAIRPHVLGRFRDLLGATARHPAMLFYLDNWLSVDPDSAARRPEGLRLLPRSGQSAPVAGGLQASGLQASRRRRGLNENYARELLELHTLGVDGGYTQTDVVEVARVFTGWTIGPPEGVRRRNGQKTAGLPRRSGQSAMAAEAGGFRFVRALHDDGAKVVLGQTVKSGGGIEDGERVLDIVAAHPSTARHIAGKLARRFVSDEPPDTLVSRAAARFIDTGGDLREVVRTIVTSPEFFATETRQAKVKTPLEFMVSAVRATGSDVTDMQSMARGLRQLGMPLYMCQPPTGYDDIAEAWVSPGALVTRINLAQQLAGGEAALISAPEFQRR